MDVPSISPFRAMTKNVNILICDDHPLVVDGLKSLLSGVAHFQIVGQANGEKELNEVLFSTPADVLLLDLHLSDGDGLELCKKINKSHPELRILGFSAIEDLAVVTNFLKSGAQGYILKTTPSDKIIEAVQKVADGESYLHPDMAMAMMKQQPSSSTSQHQYVPRLSVREKEVLKLIIQERTTSEIAEQLFISVNTVETHRNHLMQKLGARNLAGLVRIAMEKGLND